MIGRQEIQQPSPVEISLSEMGPFISDMSQAQLPPQVCQSSFGTDVAAALCGSSSTGQFFIPLL